MKQPFNPKVSIVIPVYNGSNYLKEAIDSALAQTYKNIEIIVINDGSNDEGETDKICKSYGKKIRYFKKENGGVSSALNMGIEKMEGEYFSWLSHDDVYYPEKVEKQVEALSKLSNKETIIYSDYSVVDENLEEIYTENLSEYFSAENLNKPLYSLLMGYINGISLLVHKNNFNKYGKFNEELRTTQDYDLWFRILRHSEIRYVSGVLTKTRTHLNQSSNLLREEHKVEKISLWEKMFVSLSKNEKIFLSGTVVSFYEEFYAHFNKLAINEELQEILLVSLFKEYLKNYYGESKELTKKIALQKIAAKLNVDNINYLSSLLLSTKKLTQKPRIVFWSDNWKYRGGLNRVIVSIAEQLSSQFEILICTWKDKESKNGFKIPKKTKYLEIDPSSLDIGKLPEFMLLIGVKIFVCSNNFDRKYLELYGKFKGLGIKTIAWDHSYYFLLYYYQWLLGAAKIRNIQFQNTDCVVCVNKLSSRIYSELGISAITIRNPVSIKIQKEVDINERERDIIAVGRFEDYQKRLDLLLEVFAKVLEKLPNTKLYIVGTYNLDIPIMIGASETFAQQIKRLKIPKENIIFTGYVDNVEDYYKKASLHVMTSEREGFGVVITEAAAFGIPSIVFDGNGAEDAIEDGENGYLIPSRDTELMSEKISALLTNSKELVKFSNNSLKMVKDYTPDLVSKDWSKLCNLILSNDVERLRIFIKSMNKFNHSSKRERLLINMYEDALLSIFEESDLNTKKYEEQIEALNRDILYLNDQLVERTRIKNMAKSLILKVLGHFKRIILLLPRKIINK